MDVTPARWKIWSALLRHLPHLGLDLPRDQDRRAHAAASAFRRYALRRRGSRPRRHPRRHTTVATRLAGRARISASSRVALLACGVGVVTVAETRIDSSVAAMIAGSVPLQVVIWRSIAREPNVAQATRLGRSRRPRRARPDRRSQQPLPEDRPSGRARADDGGVDLLVDGLVRLAAGLSLPTDPVRRNRPTRCSVAASCWSPPGLIVGEGDASRSTSWLPRRSLAWLYLAVIGRSSASPRTHGSCVVHRSHRS